MQELECAKGYNADIFTEVVRNLLNDGWHVEMMAQEKVSNHVVYYAWLTRTRDSEG